MRRRESHWPTRKTQDHQNEYERVIAFNCRPAGSIELRSRKDSDHGSIHEYEQGRPEDLRVSDIQLYMP